MFKFGKRDRITPFARTAGQSGFGAPLHIAFEHRPLPESGALSYALETLALPMYTPIGAGVANRQEIRTADSAPTVYQRQTIGIQSLAYNGNLSGQFTNEPLVNTDSPVADAQGIVAPAFGMNIGANEIPG